jgi:hypothetical protein
MEGFYTKQEAAHILGVSPRQINNYFNERRLSRVVAGRRVWIPREDVDALYSHSKRQAAIRPDDFEALKKRVEDVESQLDVLKLGLGFGSKRPARKDTELLLMRQRFVDALAKTAWSRKQMSGVADELATVQDVEIAALANCCGVASWVPLTDLSQRMLLHINQHPDYPGCGLDVLETRLIRARDRFFGVLYASTKSRTALSPVLADRIYDSTEVPPNAIERHIAQYLMSC